MYTIHVYARDCTYRYKTVLDPIQSGTSPSSEIAVLASSSQHAITVV